MRHKWRKLASLARKYAHSSFISLVLSLLPKDTLLRTYCFIIYGHGSWLGYEIETI